MKCPICKNDLRISKKDARYGLCDHCRKKFKLPQEQLSDTKTIPLDKTQRYSNIPPKHVRDHREQEMRQAYDELLAIGEEERSTRFSLFRRSR